MENLPSLASLFARVFGFTLLVLIAAAVCRPAAPLFSRLRAYFSKSARLLRAAKVGNAAAVRRLLAAGADVNTQDAGAWTPLLWAAQQGHAAVLRLLLENGANIGHQGFIYGSTNPGWSALTLSVNGGHIECTKILLKYGATDKDKALGSALWGGRRDIAALLKEYGADATTVTNRADRHGRTDLMGAAEEGRADTVRLLIEFGADVNARDEAGQTALMEAALMDGAEIVQLLLAAGADAGATNHEGKTALAIAREWGCAAAARVLEAAAAAA